MPVTTLRTLKPHNDHDMRTILEHVYGVSQDWISISFDEERLATIEIETEMDIDARIAVNITDEGMKAEFSLFPAINKGKTLDNEAVERYLINEKRLSKELFNWDSIKHAIQYFLAGYIVENVIVAEGMPKEDGQDAWIQLHFDLPDKKPKELDDGSVDFHEINKITCVEQNQLLISFHQETKGRDGTKVTGEKIPALKGRKLVIHKGKNVAFDEEKQGFIATEAGHVIFDGSRLSVNPIYSVNGDVDFSVGNIKFEGTVSVSGDVLSGFEITAKNIVVWGVVRDATLTAKDDITIKTGVKSSGKCVLTAGQNVIAGFLENATVYADSSIIIKNYCLNSRLFTKGFIEAHSGDGILSGGEIHAFSYVRAKKIGLEQCPTFRVHVGVKYGLNEKLENLMADKDKLEQVLKDADGKIRSMARINPDIKNNPKLKSIITSRNLLYKKFQTADERIEQMIKTSMHPTPYVRADEDVFPGAVLVFYGTENVIKEQQGPSKFIFNKGMNKIDKVRPDAPIDEAEITEVSLDE